MGAVLGKKITPPANSGVTLGKGDADKPTPNRSEEQCRKCSSVLL